MTKNKINDIRAAIKKQKPLIHSITNPISINQCANICLGIGARPIMAEHPEEVGEITETSDALMLNLGNITDARLKSIEISAAVAEKQRIPFVLDSVGVACSALRRGFAERIIKENHPQVIKGNYSEIKALFDVNYKSQGVDSESLKVREMCLISAELAKRHRTVVLASGKCDIVTDGIRLALVKNGCDQLSGITGTGCMLGELCACCLSVAEGFDAAVAACVILGVCGELSETAEGMGTFLKNLLDKLSTIENEEIEKYMKLEEIEIENL